MATILECILKGEPRPGYLCKQNDQSLPENDPIKCDVSSGQKRKAPDADHEDAYHAMARTKKVKNDSGSVTVEREVAKSPVNAMLNMRF